jgi:transcriptional regulator with XRE-family HTH domain
MNAEHYDHEKLARLRSEKYTQKEVAEKLQIAELTVLRAEKGRGASYELLLSFCTLLGVDIREILKIEPVKNVLAVN